MFKAIKRHNTVTDDDDNPSIAEELFERLKAMSSKERHDALQAKYVAHMMGIETLDDMSLELLKTLMKSFEVSIKFQELEGKDDGDKF